MATKKTGTMDMLKTAFNNKVNKYDSEATEEQNTVVQAAPTLVDYSEKIEEAFERNTNADKIIIENSSLTKKEKLEDVYLNFIGVNYKMIERTGIAIGKDRKDKVHFIADAINVPAEKMLACMIDYFYENFGPEAKKIHTKKLSQY